MLRCSALKRTGISTQIFVQHELYCTIMYNKLCNMD